jgi:acetyl esterase
VSTTAVTSQVSEAFPATFSTAGNADPLLPQSREMVAALEAKRVPVETLFYPDDHRPALGHEYQFDVSLADGRTALERVIAFFRGHAAT